MPGPRKPENIGLEPARRQVFQWRFRENLPVRILKQKMDQLSQELVKITGESYIASEGAWEGRISYWNKQIPKCWNIERRQRGPDVPIPADLTGVTFWRAWDTDVGEWAKWKNSQLGNFDMLNVPRNPFIAVSGVSHNLNQDSVSNYSSWKAQEGQNWGFSSSNDSGTSRVSSFSSGASRSTDSFSNESLSIHTYPQPRKIDTVGRIPWLNTTSDPWMYLYPPQLPHPGNYNNRNGFCDERLLAVPPAEAPEIHQLGFSYEGCQNTTLPVDDAGMSYNSPHNRDPGLLMADPLQADHRRLYMPPEQEGVAHPMVNYDHIGHFDDTMAPPSLHSSSVTDTLRLPPRDTVQHTMSLYGEYVPQEGFYGTSLGEQEW